jgi:hypothetical protein
MEVSFSDANLTTRVEAVRNICFVAILIALPVTADAQQRIVAVRGATPAPTQAAPEEKRPEHSAGERRNHDQRQHQGQPEQQRPSSGLSPIGLGLSPIGLPPAPATTTPWWERQGPPAWERQQIPEWERKQSPSWERRQLYPYATVEPARLAKTGRLGYPSHRPVLPPLIYALPPYRYFPINTTLGYGVTEYPVSDTQPPPQVAPMPETGFLRLEIEPQQTVQVFVDGLYIGMLGDIGIELELRLGPRRIELRAPGYRSLIFDTQIVFDRTVIYRGALERVEEAAPNAPAPQAPKAPQAPQAPPGSRTMYLIPGCYMGNVQPTASMLRPGCDINKMTTMTPP